MSPSITALPGCIETDRPGPFLRYNDTAFHGDAQRNSLGRRSPFISSILGRSDKSLVIVPVDYVDSRENPSMFSCRSSQTASKSSCRRLGSHAVLSQGILLSFIQHDGPSPGRSLFGWKPVSRDPDRESRFEIRHRRKGFRDCPPSVNHPSRHRLEGAASAFTSSSG
jgi:hypothetical protein